MDSEDRSKAPNMHIFQPDYFRLACIYIAYWSITNTEYIFMPSNHSLIQVALVKELLDVGVCLISNKTH